ncbi:hypothetical protein EV05_0410 [Prochlorococcus sp. MIT 0601]|nr:hypothetical protein EV05_0410 [Prochlorococcus sp. MIT 0601]
MFAHQYLNHDPIPNREIESAHANANEGAAIPNHFSKVMAS